MRLTRHTGWMFLVFIVLTSFVWGQDRSQIHGRVLDETKGVLKGATLRLVSRSGQLRLHTVSNLEGVYRFDHLPAGDYLIEVEVANFRKTVRDLTLQAGQSIELDIELQTAAINEEITVTAAGTPQTVDETSKSLSAINEQQLEQRDEYSVVEALRIVPGLRVQQLGGPGSFSNIFIRGLRVVDTSVMIDGFRVRDASDLRGSVNPFLQDLVVNNLERVEVLRGSGSSLYGSNAVGGVINLIQREGTGRVNGSLGFEGGSLSFFRERAAISGSLNDRFSYSVGATRIDRNKGVDVDDKYRSTTLGGKAGYNIQPNIQIHGTAHFAKSFLQINDSPFPIGPLDNPFGFALRPGTNRVVGFIPNLTNPDYFRNSHLFLGGISFTHQVNQVWGYSASYHSVQSRRTFVNGPAQSPLAMQLGIPEFPFRSTSEGLIHTINVRHNLNLGRHNLVTAGLEAERENFTQKPRGTDRQSSFAFFAQDQLRFLKDRLQLSAAFRVQDFSIRNPETVPEIKGIHVPRAVTGDGSIAYSFPSKGTKLRAHVGNSFRAPSLPERFQFFRGERIGNPLLRPERAISVDGGLDQLLWRERLRFGATYFYSRLQEVTVFTTFLRQFNERGPLSRGLELNASVVPSPGFDLSTSYTFTNAKQILSADRLTSSNIVLRRGSAIPAFSIPKHNFSIQMNKRFHNGINVNFDFSTIGQYLFRLFDPIYFSQVFFTFRGYRKADGVVSYTRKLTEGLQITVYGKVNNLFNNGYFEDGFRAPGLWGLGGIKFGF